MSRMTDTCPLCLYQCYNSKLKIRDRRRGRKVFREWISGLIPIQQLPEFLQTGYLDRRAKQRF